MKYLVKIKADVEIEQTYPIEAATEKEAKQSAYGVVSRLHAGLVPGTFDVIGITEVHQDPPSSRPHSVSSAIAGISPAQTGRLRRY